MIDKPGTGHSFPLRFYDALDKVLQNDITISAKDAKKAIEGILSEEVDLTVVHLGGLLPRWRRGLMKTGTTRPSRLVGKEDIDEVDPGLRIIVIYRNGTVATYASEVKAIGDINLLDRAAAEVNRVFIGKELKMVTVTAEVLMCFKKSE